MQHITNISANNVIAVFIEKSSNDEEFTALLISSLTKAKQIAEKKLKASLYKALQWPSTLAEYVHYLTTFAEWIPQESKEDIWIIPGTNGHQEIDDRTNHFYWLIDQEVGEKNKVLVENITWFSKWLIEYSKNWGNFLNTSHSLNADTFSTFQNNSPLYKVEDSMVMGKPNNPSGWLTFNQFFARTLNPGLRPISNPFNNKTITSPADCNFKSTYKIADDSTIPEILIKSTHKYASVQQLLAGSNYKDAFANGTFVHYYLSTFSYHRFHTPVAGIVKECYPIHGLVYLDVVIKDKQFDSPDNAEDGYEFAQARGVIIIDTKNSPYGNIGIVAVIPIGMCQVSSVNMIATVGNNLNKGDEFGYFLFGGSDIIILFQAGVIPQIDTNKSYRHYGSAIATCTLK